VGTVEAGKEADLVLYDGNPLEEMVLLLTPRLVLRAGDVVAGDLTATDATSERSRRPAP
jgi:imidazolonepropionase-like amidohydrolase